MDRNKYNTRNSNQDFNMEITQKINWDSLKGNNEMPGKLDFHNPI